MNFGTTVAPTHSLTYVCAMFDHYLLMTLIDVQSPYQIAIESLNLTLLKLSTGERLSGVNLSHWFILDVLTSF